MTQKQVIVVAGFHRSGTSAFTRVISLAGAHISERQIETNDFNEKGYWESSELVRIQDDALVDAKRDWDDLRIIPPSWVEGPEGQRHIKRLQSFLLKETAGYDITVIKDPRIGMLMSLWQRALENTDIEALYVIPVRAPMAVARSLQRRNGFSAEKSLWLWLNHNLAVERQTRGPKRVFVDYTTLLDNPLITLEKIWEVLGLSAPKIDENTRKSIVDFVTPALNHSDAGPQIALPEAITTAFEALKAAYNSNGSNLLTSFDAISDAQTWPCSLLEDQGKDFDAREGTRNSTTTGNSNDVINSLHREINELRYYRDIHDKTYSNRSGPALGLIDKAALLRQHGIANGLGLIKQYELVRNADFFDAPRYLSLYADVRGLGINPLIHYLQYGHMEGRSPNELFHGEDYKAVYADVRDQGVNPLIHYLRNGQREGRLARPGDADNTAYGNYGGGTIETKFLNHLRYVTEYLPVELAPQPEAFDASRMDIHFVIPDFAPGAGGHMTIFRIVRWLENFGHQVTLWIQNPSVHKSPNDAFDDINTYFQQVQANVRFLPKDLSAITGDAIIATDRWTAYPVRAMSKFRRRFYFVQDHETEFYPSGAYSLLTEQTYRFGFDCLCAGEWLTQLMTEKYGLWAHKWDLAYDPAVYNIIEPALRKPGHIAFYARHATARRAVELGMLAFDVLAERGVDFHVDFYGANLGDMKVPYHYTSHGILSAEQLGSLYRSCELGMVMSATNYSLVPREMLACGLPVIELDVDSTRAVFADSPITLVEPDPCKMADTIEALLSDPSKRNDLSARGIESVEKFDWETSARSVEEGIILRLTGR